MLSTSSGTSTTPCSFVSSLFGIYTPSVTKILYGNINSTLFYESLMWHLTFNGTQNIFMTTSWPQLAALGYQYGHFCVPIVSHRIVTFGYLTQWLGEPTEGGPISVTILRAPLCKPRNAREYALKCIFYRFALAEMGKNWYFLVVSIATKNRRQCLR